MNSKRALEQTKKQFTNLIDGTVKNGCTVSEIIAYYEGCLSNRKPVVKKLGNIESNFQEDYLRELEDDQDEFMRWMH
jgi:hypothetical protein